MDDIKISSRMLELHIHHLQLVNEVARSCGFEFEFTKCRFLASSIVLWGFVCDEFGRKADPPKIEQVKNWTEPKTKEELVSFLCFANYLRE